MPLHFCYFFPQTPSTESATEHGNAGTRERREREFSHADSADCANFLGGAASCRSIFVIFSRKLQALKARQNTGAGFFQLRQLWENLRETKIFCLSPRKGEFFSRRFRRLCKFFGRSGILPLHFCYFFSQTPNAESATEYGKLRGNAGMGREIF